MAPKPTKGRAERQRVPALRLVDESCMSDRSTDKGRSYPAKHTPYRLGWPDSGVSRSVHVRKYLHLYRGKHFSARTVIPTLCSSEVPQDRWCGRTAGSGMWTQHENLSPGRIPWTPPSPTANKCLQLPPAGSGGRRPFRRSSPSLSRGSPRGGPRGPPEGPQGPPCLLYTSPSPRD